MKKDVAGILTSSYLPNGRAVGLSGLSYEIIRKVCKGDEAKSLIAKLLNDILTNPERMPRQLCMARLIGIEKPNGGVRPLCIQETLIKVLNKILTIKITNIIRESLMTTQKCLARSEGQILARDQVKGYIEDGFEAIIQFDFKNAFGTICRKSIISRLLHYNVERTTINYIIHVLNNQKVIYETKDGNEVIDIVTGVPQGEPMSMVLFSLGIDKLLEEFDSMDDIEVTAYADDVVIAVKRVDMIDNIISLFSQKAKEYGLSLNEDKTCIGYIRNLSEEEKELLKTKSGELKDLRKESMTYVGLPITLNKGLEIEYVKKKIDETVKMSTKLWESKAAIQVKYHLQKMCVDSELDYVLRATPWDKTYDGVWLDDMQNKLYEIWAPITKIVPKVFLRLPVKYLGVGMLHIKDRWKIIRNAYENRLRGNMEDCSLPFYKRKTEKWIKKGLMPRLDIQKVPGRANVSLAAPPSTNQHRLSNGAFKLMLALRYSSEGCDDQMKGLEEYGGHKCTHHPDETLTLQHIISCGYLVKRYVIEQHERIVQILYGILNRNGKTSHVHKETYSDRQNAQHQQNGKGHRADIVYMFEGLPHSVDVIVTSSNNDARGNNVTRALGTKEREYVNERRLHIVLLDTAGNMAEESWNYLHSMGMRSDDLRTIHRVLFECVERRIKAVIEDAKYQNK